MAQYLTDLKCGGGNAGGPNIVEAAIPALPGTDITPGAPVALVQLENGDDYYCHPYQIIGFGRTLDSLVTLESGTFLWDGIYRKEFGRAIIRGTSAEYLVFVGFSDSSASTGVEMTAASVNPEDGSIIDSSAATVFVPVYASEEVRVIVVDQDSSYAYVLALCEDWALVFTVDLSDGTISPIGVEDAGLLGLFDGFDQQTPPVVRWGSFASGGSTYLFGRSEAGTAYWHVLEVDWDTPSVTCGRQTVAGYTSTPNTAFLLSNEGGTVYVAGRFNGFALHEVTAIGSAATPAVTIGAELDETALFTPDDGDPPLAWGDGVMAYVDTGNNFNLLAMSGGAYTIEKKASFGYFSSGVSILDPAGEVALCLKGTNTTGVASPSVVAYSYAGDDAVVGGTLENIDGWRPWSYNASTYSSYLPNPSSALGVSVIEQDARNYMFTSSNSWVKIPYQAINYLVRRVSDDAAWSINDYSIKYASPICFAWAKDATTVYIDENMSYGRASLVTPGLPYIQASEMAYPCVESKYGTLPPPGREYGGITYEDNSAYFGVAYAELDTMPKDHFDGVEIEITQGADGFLVWGPRAYAVDTISADTGVRVKRFTCGIK